MFKKFTLRENSMACVLVVAFIILFGTFLHSNVDARRSEKKPCENVEKTNEKVSNDYCFSISRGWLREKDLFNECMRCESVGGVYTVGTSFWGPKPSCAR